MTQEHGIIQENHGVNKTYHLLQKGGNLQLTADFTIESDRKIYGIAHVPVIDRENELILADAIRDSLPAYMKLPILHVQHTERPVGTVTKAYVDADGKLHIYAEIKDTEDTNDVWADIKSGVLNKFSIFGKRVDASPECALAPTQRVSPCVTKALTLFSISVVGENAMNQETFLEVAKSFESKGGDSTPVGKYESMSSCIAANSDKDSPGGYCASIEHQATGKWPAEKAMEDKEEEKEVEKCSGKDLEKSELVHEPTNMSSIMGRLDGIEKSIAALYEMAQPVVKSEDEEEDKMEEKEKDEKVEKAAPEEPKTEVKETPEVVKADPGYITKAELDTFQKAHDELKKAYDDLTARVDKMEKETIEKGGHVVVLSNQYVDDNPNLANVKAIGV